MGWLSIGLGIVGAVAGAFIGQPYVGYMMGAMIGANVGMMVGGLLERPSSEQPATQGPAKLMMQTSSYGGVVPVVFGRRRIAGNFVWVDTLETVTVEHESGGGGGCGGGGGGGSYSTYEYYLSFAICLCIGPKTVTRMWKGKDEYFVNISSGVASCYPADGGGEWTARLYAGVGGFLAAVLGGISQDPAFTFNIYYGNPNTTADPTMAAKVTRAPVWPNYCYVVFNRYFLGDYPNIPQFTFEVSDLDEPVGCLKELARSNVLGFDPGQRILELDGYLYVLGWSSSKGQNVIAKIATDTMTIVDSVDISTDTMSVCQINTNMIEVDAATIATVAAGKNGMYYIFEIDKTSLAIVDKRTAGHVVLGTDGKKYQPRAYYANWPTDAEGRPVTGTNWATYYIEADADTDDGENAWGYWTTQVCPSGVNMDIAYLDGYYYISRNDSDYDPKIFRKERRGEAIVTGTGGYFGGWVYAIGGDLYIVGWGPWGGQIHHYNAALDLIEVDGGAAFGYPVHPAVHGNNIYVAKDDWVPDDVCEVLKYDVTNLAAGPVAYYTAPFRTGGVKSVGVSPSGNEVFVGYLSDRMDRVDTSDMTLICYELLDNQYAGTNMAVDDAGYIYWPANDGLAGHTIMKVYIPVSGGLLDVTPQSITRAVTTNKFYGLGLDDSYINDALTDHAEDYAERNDLLVSMIFDQQRSYLDTLQYVIQHHDGFITYMDGKIAHRQLEIEDEEIEFYESGISDSFDDGSIADQWTVKS